MGLAARRVEVAESFSHLVLNVLHNLVLSGPWFTFSRVRSHMAFHGDLGQPFGTERADAPVGKWGGAHVQADPASWVEVAESFSHLVLNVLHNLALQTINPLLASIGRISGAAFGPIWLSTATGDNRLGPNGHRRPFRARSPPSDVRPNAEETQVTAVDRSNGRGIDHVSTFTNTLGCAA